jgi:hypothetical protein
MQREGLNAKGRAERITKLMYNWGPKVITRGLLMMILGAGSVQGSGIDT